MLSSSQASLLRLQPADVYALLDASPDMTFRSMSCLEMRFTIQDDDAGDCEWQINTQAMALGTSIRDFDLKQHCL